MDETQSLTLKTLKHQDQIRKCLKSTCNFIKKDTNNIPTLEQLTDDNKGEFVEYEDTDFAKMFNGLLDYTYDEELEMDNLDWNSVNYEIYGADYYEEKFPGFAPEIYELLAESTKEENKLIDNRIPPLKIPEGEFVVNFD